MSIGNKIFEQRTARKLSQGDLADLLDVSRQSVSKWETDSAVPDLDKLCKLCDVFDITLDELTCRKPNSTSTYVKKDNISMHQKIIGYILLAISLMAAILIWVLAENEDELYIPIPIIMSALTCSLICLFVKQKAGYWCIWSVASPIFLLSPYIIVLSMLNGLKLILILFYFAMAFLANKIFSETIINKNRKKSILVLFEWLALAGLRIISYLIRYFSIIDTPLAMLPYFITDIFIYIGTALLLTYTICYIKNKKVNNDN